MDFRLMREIEEEKILSEYATKSMATKGRLVEEKPCEIRTCFERDADRILYALEFRRLRHKTQVFFNAQNDHICTRMEHVLYVSAISRTIARSLKLNTDLTNAIALGHDLGHAPFGHTGEKVLNECIKRVDPNLGFHHETHGLRVVDKLATRVYSVTNEYFNGLNLSFEVRDGIVSHCGELASEYILNPNRGKTMADLERISQTNTIATAPATMEGCVVRLVDKISYVGRDIEDAVRTGIMDYEDLSPELKNTLGISNGQIINRLVQDLIENSYDKDCICLSQEKAEALTQLIKANYEYIYKNPRIKRFEEQSKIIIEGLFEELYKCELMPSSEMEKDGVKRSFLKFVETNNYDKDTSRVQMVVDFIAGMTDKYATKCFEELYWM